MTTLKLCVSRARLQSRKRLFGDVAQLVEHHNGIVGVRGSIPLISTKLFFLMHTNLKHDTVLPNTMPVVSLRKSDATVKTIQTMLRASGVKMSAIEIRELMRTAGLTADETRIKSYVRQLRQGF